MSCARRPETLPETAVVVFLVIVAIVIIATLLVADMNNDVQIVDGETFSCRNREIKYYGGGNIIRGWGWRPMTDEQYERFCGDG